MLKPHQKPSHLPTKLRQRTSTLRPAKLRIESPPTTKTAKIADQIVRPGLNELSANPPPPGRGLRGLRCKSVGFRTLERLSRCWHYKTFASRVNHGVFMSCRKLFAARNFATERIVFGIRTWRTIGVDHPTNFCSCF